MTIEQFKDKWGNRLDCEMLTIAKMRKQERDFAADLDALLATLKADAHAAD